MGIKQKRQRHADRLEVVAQAIAAGKSPVEASAAAGYPQGSSFASNARKRAQRADVRSRVREIQAEGAARAAVTAESLIVETEEARSLAMAIEAPAAAVSAIIAKAKLAGIWRERAEVTGKDGKPLLEPPDLSKLTNEQLATFEQLVGVIAPLAVGGTQSPGEGGNPAGA